MAAPAVAIIGAALDLGAGRRGVDMGPSAIRYAGLEERLTSLGRDCADWGNVETAVAEATASGDPRARFLTEIRSCERVARRVGDAVGEGRVPIVLGGVGTAVRGGLSYREAHLAMELVAESGLLGSFEIVEVNPILDRENATAALAVELAASAFGARIL